MTERRQNRERKNAEILYVNAIKSKNNYAKFQCLRVDETIKTKEIKRKIKGL